MIKNEQELNEKIEHCSSCLDEKFAPTEKGKRAIVDSICFISSI